MGDFLVELGDRPAARGMIRGLGLPIPLPQRLRRSDGPWSEQPLAETRVAVGGVVSGELSAVVARTLGRAGASAVLVATDVAGTPFVDAAEAYGRPVEEVASFSDAPKLDALVFDATGLSSAEDLERLWGFFGPAIPALRPNGRIVVVSRVPTECAGPAAACAQRAVEGFVRSLAKEVGRQGTTANVIRVRRNADDRLGPPLRWFLSAGSAFVSGQMVTVSSEVVWSKTPVWRRAFDQRNVLVTGAARGIGEATARRLAAEGARVYVLDRPDDAARCEALAAEIGGVAVPLDITSAEAPAELQRLGRAAGGFHGVVHNAGVTRDRTLKKMDIDRWRLAVDVNLGAVIRITEALLDDGLADDARVVLLSSVAGIAGNFGQTNYAASKAGLLGLLEVMAPSLAAQGVALNAIAPGFIETRLTAAIPVATREGARRLSALSQGGLPVDVAEAITFLCAPQAAALSGQVLRVCGGALIGA